VAEFSSDPTNSVISNPDTPHTPCEFLLFVGAEFA